MCTQPICNICSQLIPFPCFILFYFLCVPTKFYIYDIVDCSGSCESLIVDRSSWTGHWQATLKFELPSDLSSFNLDLTTDLPLDSLTFWQGTLSGSGQTFSLESPSYFSGKEGDSAEFGFQISFSGDEEPSFTSINLNGEDLCSTASTSETSTSESTVSALGTVNIAG